MGAENRHTVSKANYITLTDTSITDLDIEQGHPGGEPNAQPTVGQTLYFTATATGSNVEYLWDFGDETLSAATTATGKYAQHSYDAPGSYTVTLTARNGADEQVATMPVIVTAAANVKHDLLLPMIEP